jgi:hypothetical protein
MKTTKEQITYYTTEDEQVEAMVNGQSDAIFETRRRKAIRRITRPMLIMLALTFVAWLITLLGLLGLVDSIAAEAAKGVCLVATMISAVVVTVRVMGGVD